jgi:hypothetical protein
MQPRTDATAPPSRRRGAGLLCAVATAIALTLALPALASAAPANDLPGTAQSVALYSVITGDVTDANELSQETLTTASGFFCNEPPGGAAGPEDWNYENVIWYEVTAEDPTATTMTVTTFGVTQPSPGTGFDSAIAFFDTDKAGRNGAPASSFVGCNNNGPSFSLNRSKLTITGITPGLKYLVAVGVKTGTTPVTNQVRFVASQAPPLNSEDNRSGANLAVNTLADGVPKSGRDNMGATEQGGEDLACGSAPLGSTVWYRYNVPGPGTLTVNTTGSNGMDSVVQAYKGSSTTPSACNDDAPGLIGESRLRMNVTAGTYFIQVGGYAGRQFGYSIVGNFSPDLDIDNDGVSRPSDCNDNNGAIKPGAPDTRGNGVDENCDGVDGQRFDRDGDGFRSNGSPADCNDSNRAIHPGARDVPGNGVNEDCRGGDARKPRKRKRAIRLKFGWSFFGSGKVRSLTVRPSRGARVRVTCKGRGCPSTKRFKSNGRRKQLKRFFKRPLKRATINIVGTKKGFYGRWIRIKVKPGGLASDRDGCLKPGSRRIKRKCPS